MEQGTEAIQRGNKDTNYLYKSPCHLCGQQTRLGIFPAFVSGDGIMGNFHYFSLRLFDFSAVHIYSFIDCKFYHS